MKRQQGSLANFGFSTSVARVRVKQDVGTEVGEGYTSLFFKFMLQNC